MGQYFTFINIDKRQQLGSCGGMKMGEFFFSVYPASIIKLLAVPEGKSNEPEDKVPEEDFWGRPRDLASWAGDRIICMGDYVTDWPDHILTSDDCKSLEGAEFLYSHAVRIRYNNVPEAPTYSGGGVLRNLTKKIYVRAADLPALTEDYKLRYFKDPPPIDYVPGLGTILLSRVGWSADPSAAMCWKDADSLTQGEWAGDKIDVRSYNEVKEELESGGWIDTTELEAERLTSLWKSDSGHYNSDEDQ